MGAARFRTERKSGHPEKLGNQNRTLFLSFHSSRWCVYLGVRLVYALVFVVELVFFERQQYEDSIIFSYK